MALESTMICLDNSDWMRNGDYLPSRLDAQQDAASLICNDRTNSNPESTVGILSMAGQGVDLLVSPTEDQGKILTAFSRLAIGGNSDLATSLQIAQLALKHRKNKNGGQRIIAFIGGPVTDSKETLTKIGKQLKKNNVAIDIVSFGEIEENSEKLAALVETTSSNDNSHLITVPCDVSPVNAILSSPIIHMGGGIPTSMGGGGGGGAMAGSAAGGADFDIYGGIDPTQDPELAMAIRVSTEEARANEEARVKAAQEQSALDTSSSSSSSSSSAAAGGGGDSGNASGAVAEPFGGYGAMDEEDEDALMQKALEMSMSDMPQGGGGGSSSAPILAATSDDADGDEELRMALQLSVANDAPSSSSASASAPSSSSASAFQDPSFVNQLLGTADLNDPLVQAAIAQLNAGADTKNNNDAEKSKKRKGDDI